ncbi:hypothetical protein AgCh_031346 [Apium graveolens]
MSISSGDERACALEEEEERRIHVFWDAGMLEHDTGKGVFDTGMDPGFLDVLDKHPENADRVKNMLSILKKEYINEMVEADRYGGKNFCSGTFLNPGSWHASLLDAGTAMSTMKHILNGPGKILESLKWPRCPIRFYRGPIATAPPPLVRYCADDSTLEIVFPDWSFWRWPEINIKPWDSLLKDLK